MHSQLTSNIDVAQVVLYAFWIFFFGLIYWLRLEDRREGYPLESDNPRRVGMKNVLIPAPKTFLLPHGGSVTAPNFERDTREFDMQRTGNAAGSAMEPIGDPMLAGVGPGAWAARSDTPELTREGHIAIQPMRVATEFSMLAGPDPRGWEVVAADGKSPGVIKDIWIDRADVMVRYLEVELAGEGGTRLVPMPMLRLRKEKKKVEVVSILAEHFASVPQIKDPEQVTLLEEDKVQAFYAGGRLYAEPKRIGPAV